MRILKFHFCTFYLKYFWNILIDNSLLHLKYLFYSFCNLVKFSLSSLYLRWKYFFMNLYQNPFSDSYRCYKMSRVRFLYFWKMSDILWIMKISIFVLTSVRIHGISSNIRFIWHRMILIRFWCISNRLRCYALFFTICVIIRACLD